MRVLLLLFSLLFNVAAGRMILSQADDSNLEPFTPLFESPLQVFTRDNVSLPTTSDNFSLPTTSDNFSLPVNPSVSGVHHLSNLYWFLVSLVIVFVVLLAIAGTTTFCCTPTKDAPADDASYSKIFSRKPSPMTRPYSCFGEESLRSSVVAALHEGICKSLTEVIIPSLDDFKRSVSDVKHSLDILEGACDNLRNVQLRFFLYEIFEMFSEVAGTPSVKLHKFIQTPSWSLTLYADKVAGDTDFKFCELDYIEKVSTIDKRKLAADLLELKKGKMMVSDLEDRQLHGCCDWTHLVTQFVDPWHQIKDKKEFILKCMRCTNLIYFEESSLAFDNDLDTIFLNELDRMLSVVLCLKSFFNLLDERKERLAKVGKLR